jgi:transposase
LIWHADKTEPIELHYLPTYSPELNPDERLNADLKYAIGSKLAPRTKAKLKAAATEHLQMIENNPERVKRYFKDLRVAYTA